MTITALALVPLLFGVAVAVATLVITLQRRTRAQAVCVRETSRLADELGRGLRKLTALNARARMLRRSLRAAQKARAIAGLGGPEAAAAAQALVTAIQWLRTGLAAQQRMILAQADLARLRHRRAFSMGARDLRAREAHLRFGHARALAVRARPPGDLAPEYVPIDDFERRQRVTGTIVLGLASHVERWGVRRHTMTCAVTNEERDKKWRPKIVAANAPSKWPWWGSH